jgi:hypothetical protein
MTGAFGYMDYDEVKTFASVYDLQSQFSERQNEVIEKRLAAFAAMQFWDPAKATSREVEDWKQQIRLAYAAAIAEQQIGSALLKVYDEVLDKP